MGGQLSSFSPGCFPQQRPVQHFGQFVFQYMTVDTPLDCDCHAQGACRWGEPSMPPPLEFMNTPVSRDDLAKCPGIVRYPTLPHRSTWDEEPPDIAPNWRTNDPGDSPDAIYNIADIFRALEIFPESVRKEIKGTFDYIDPRERQLRSEQTADPDRAFSPSLLMGILLADPQLRARQVIETLPPKMANTIMRCSEYATNETIRRVSRPVDGKTVPQRKAYVDAMKHIVDAWMRHAPARPDESALWLPNPADGDVDGVCHQVYQKAISNVDQPDKNRRFVANHYQIMTALELAIDMSWNDPIVHAMRFTGTVGQGLDWSEAQLAAAFGPLSSALTVGMNFFTLMMYGSLDGQANLHPNHVM